MGRLTGKRALVTAAGQGIGRAVAEAFAAEGADVIAADINPATLATLTGMTTRVLDVRSKDAVAQAAAEIGTIDVLFNAAGFVHHGTLLDCSEEDWAFSFDLNVTSMFRLPKAFLPGMLEKGAGSVINVASAASSIVAAPNRCVYGATKAAVIGFTKAVAADFVAKGIRCNAICPGTIESPSLFQRMEDLGQKVGGVDEARKLFLARQPSGRLGTAHEVAMLGVYLASDESSFTTGAAIVVDGGWSNV
jgi:2-keto-3-deoxy-L-fuconate dehydrogenase